MESDDQPEVKFKLQIQEKYNSDKTTLMSKEDYFGIIEEIRVANADTSTKTKRQYYLLKRFVFAI